MQKNKTYFFVTPFFPSPDNWRGSYCYDFVKALLRERSDLRVEVFVPGNGGDYEIGELIVHRFKTKQLPSNLLPFLFRKHNEQSFLLAVRKTGINVKDVVVCHGHTANFAIYPLAVKRTNPNCLALLHHHDLCSFGLNLGRLHKCWIYNLIMFPVLRRLHEQIDGHVFISEASRRSFLSAPDTDWTVYADYKKQMRGLPYRSVHVKKSFVLHNGIDAKLFYEEASSSNNNSGKIVLGCVANYLDLKGHVDLLNAVAVLRSRGYGIFVRLVGNGHERKRCEKLAKDLGVDAEFIDEMRHEDLPDFYRSLDLFVMPSYFEGFGCVYVESWACGTPFVACEGQGIEDMIADNEKALWLAKPRDAIDLANKIEYFIQHHPAQHLKGPISFNETVPQFIRELGI